MNAKEFEAKLQGIDADFKVKKYDSAGIRLKQLPGELIAQDAKKGSYSIFWHDQIVLDIDPPTEEIDEWYVDIRSMIMGVSDIEKLNKVLLSVQEFVKEID